MSIKYAPHIVQARCVRAQDSGRPVAVCWVALLYIFLFHRFNNKNNNIANPAGSRF